MRSSTRNRILFSVTGTLTVAFMAAVFAISERPTPTQQLASRESKEVGTTRSLGSVSQTDPTPAAVTDTVRSFLANFYAAYAAQDARRLASYFSADTSAYLVNQRFTLFTGQDSKGNAATPQLFINTPANQVAASYRLQSAQQQGSNWRLVISEDRLTLPGSVTAGTTEVELTLVPAPVGTGTWLVDSYAYLGGSGKYGAFLAK